MCQLLRLLLHFFFNGTAPTEIYTLSLHDALPILCGVLVPAVRPVHVPLPRGRVLRQRRAGLGPSPPGEGDRKSTRLNSSHSQISYAVFCLKKKKSIT